MKISDFMDLKQLQSIQDHFLMLQVWPLLQ